MIFNIYIDDLLEKLEKKNIPENMFAYADDIMVFQESILKTEENIKIIREWNRENLMSLNDDKCGIV